MSDLEIIGRKTDAELTHQLLSTAWTPMGRVRASLFAVAFALTGLLFTMIAKVVLTGIGVFGNNIPVGWAFDIINFVWWIGIGHAGTFISAVLLLFEQRWRTSINRFAEAMTLFAVIQAGIFPVLHLGRPWFAYWVVPYPSTMRTWPNFRSALPWDAAAISTYFTVSLLFWYVGLLPDLAAMRDAAPGRWRRLVAGVFALGWRGSTEQTRHYRIVYGLLAGFATPLVISVHSIVSSDFAEALVPGWHSTLFPPLFVAGAVFSGFAMVATLLIPTRRAFRLENVITKRHLDALAKMILVTGWVVIYSYIVEDFCAWYGGDPVESYQMFVARPSGPGSTAFWLMLLGNVVAPNVLWLKRARTSPVVLFVVSIAVNVGMWCERFVIIVQSLERDFLPSAWRPYSPTYVDWSILAGTIGFFAFLFLGFLRYVPFVPAAEVKELNRHLAEEPHA